MTFIPDIASLLQFAGATIIIALTPGPDMTLFVGRAISQGRSAGLACMAGCMSGLLVHTTLAALGLSALVKASPSAFLVLKVVGAAYLVWLAFQALTKGSAFSPGMETRIPRSIFRNWMTGLATNLLNPKILLFFITFLQLFVKVDDPHAAGKLFFLGMLFIVISIPLTIAMVLAADRLSHTLREHPRLVRWMDYLFAGVFSAFAVKILATQVR